MHSKMQEYASGIFIRYHIVTMSSPKTLASKKPLEAAAPIKNSTKVFLVIFLLALASSLAMVIENLPIGLLINMRKSFHTSESAIGLTVTGYAFVVALTAGPLMSYSQRFDRKHTLLVTFAVYALSCLLTAFSHNYVELLISRIMGGLAHGLFWALIAVYCAAISPKKDQSRNLALILAGSSTGMAFGVPAATWIGQHTNWRWSFGVIGVLLLVLFCFAAGILHSSLPERTLRTEPDHIPLTKIPGIFPMLAMVGFVILGQFTIFTYITLFFNSRGYTLSQGTVLLLLIGFAGLIGLGIGAKFSHVSHVKRSQILVWVFLCAVVAVYFAPHIFLVFLATLLLWGMLYSIIPSYLQPLALNIGGKNADIVSGLYVGVYNSGIGAGALLGGQIIALAQQKGLSDHSIQWLFFAAIVLIFIGAICGVFLPKPQSPSASRDKEGAFSSPV